MRPRALGSDDLVVVLLPDGGRGYLSKIFSDKWMADYGFLRAPGQTTVGDVLRAKSGETPALVHAHPNETVREAIDILREYGVSQLPVVRAEPPVTAGEVVGSVDEKQLLDALFKGTASAGGRARTAHVAPAADHRVGRAGDRGGSGAVGTADALLVHVDGKPAGVITRQDLLGHLAGSRSSSSSGHGAERPAASARLR